MSLPKSRRDSNTRDLSHLAEAITTLKLGQSLTVMQQAATNTLIREALLMKRALEWYADSENWLDEVPMQPDQDGLLTIPDQGKRALWALHRLDIQLGPAELVEEADAEAVVLDTVEVIDPAELPKAEPPAVVKPERIS